KVYDERFSAQDEIEVDLQEQRGPVYADLKLGVNVAGATSLSANLNISSPGVKLHGSGFIITQEVAKRLGLGTVPGLEKHIRAYRNGRDLAQSPRGVMVIDLFGVTADEARERFPAVYQHALNNVKPERDQNNRATY